MFASLIATLALSATAFGALADVELSGDLQEAQATNGSIAGADEVSGESRYREVAANERRELRIRNEETQVWNNAGTAKSDAPDDTPFHFTVAGNDIKTNAPGATVVTVPSEDGKIELRAREETDKPDENNVDVPDLDGPSHRVLVKQANGFVVAAGLLQTDQ